MRPYLADPDVTVYLGDSLDVLRSLPDESVHCCVTDSAPSFVRGREECRECGSTDDVLFGACRKCFDAAVEAA